MKNYKIVPEPITFIITFICSICAVVSLYYFPKEVMEHSLGKSSVVIIFLVLSTLSLLFSIIFGRIEEINQGELLDGE